jgi:hypothetical protein
MEHAALMGVLDRVADVEEPPEELPQLQAPGARVAAQGLVVVGAGNGLPRWIRAALTRARRPGAAAAARWTWPSSSLAPK